MLFINTDFIKRNKLHFLPWKSFRFFGRVSSDWRWNPGMKRTKYDTELIQCLSDDKHFSGILKFYLSAETEWLLWQISTIPSTIDSFLMEKCASECLVLTFRVSVFNINNNRLAHKNANIEHIQRAAFGHVLKSLVKQFFAFCSDVWRGHENPAEYACL